MISSRVLCKFMKLAFNANVKLLHCPLLQNVTFKCISPQRLALSGRNVSVNCVAYIHCSQTVRFKFFPNIENQTMHSTMGSMAGYENVVPYPTFEAFKSMYVQHGVYPGSEDIFHKFIVTTLETSKSELNMEDRRFHEMVRSLVRYIPRARDDQLLTILASLCFWRTEARYGGPMFRMLWNNLDRECDKRVWNWAPSFKLLVANYWFHLRLSSVSKYNESMIKNMIESKDILSVPQLVQLMFYVNLQRNTPQTLLKSMEDKLEHIIKDINIQELGIICLGFFKTQNRVVSKHIVKSILIRLISEVGKGDTFFVCACFKFLRLSMHGDLKDLYISLLFEAVKHMSRFDVPAVVHLTVLSSGINIYMPKVLEAAMDRVIEKQSMMRAKDAMKLLHCLAQFNHQLRPDFDKCVRTALEEREKEITDFPRILIYALISYAYLGVYPINLIEKALQPEFVKRCIDFHGVEMMNPIAILNYCVEIECENYNGPKVDQSFLKILRNEKGNIPQDRGHQTYQARFIALTFNVLSELYDSRDICIKHVLPHMYSPDIIVRLNSKSETPLSSILDPLENCIIKPPPDEVWVSIMVCGGYCFAHNSKQLNGVTSMKHRHLLKLGYKVLFLPNYEAGTTAQLKTYLKQNFEMLKRNNYQRKFYRSN